MVKKNPIDNSAQTFSFWANYDEGMLQYKIKNNVGMAF